MPPTDNGNTVFLTEQETERIKNTVKKRLQQCTELGGRSRESRDAKDAISQATGASLMADMSDMTMGAGQGNAPSTLPVIPVGQPYPPCNVSLDELQPMKLADLQMETHHRGRQLIVKRASPVVVLAARSWAMVQDEDGETERIEVVLHTSRHGKDALESASDFIIKEPYFTLSEDGEATLRIDHPSDLLPQPKKPAKAPTEAEQTALAYKEKGNAALQKGDLVLAHAHYTTALSLSPEPPLSYDLHRNRAHVNILLTQYDAAHADALSAVIPDDPAPSALNSKAYHRAALAAYQLRDYQTSHDLATLQQQTSPPSDPLATANLTKSSARLAEQSSGTYNFPKLSKTALRNPRLDAASFYANTTIKPHPLPHHGRGLFATCAIPAGGLVLCEKGFVVVWGREKEAQSVLTFDVRDDKIRVAAGGLVRGVVDRMRLNPSLVKEVMGLRGGWEEEGKDVDGEKEGENGEVVDVFRVQDIVARNAFGAEGEGGSAGLWVRAAYINHSCVANTEREFIGDLMIGRATRDIAKGEEILWSYDESGDYEARQKALMHTWGFECDCKLCEVEKGDDPAVRKKRKELVQQAEEFVSSFNCAGAKRLTVVKAQRLARAIDETYDEKRYKGLPHLAARRIREWLAKATVPR